MNRIVIALLTALVLTGCRKEVIDEGRTNSALQHDLDILRMQDIKTIGGYIEAYKVKTGNYPLVRQDSIAQYVHIATDAQEKYIQGSPPEAHVVTDGDVLEQELKIALGHDVVLPKDPQKVPVHKPNFYIYLTRGEHYWLAVHLHSPCSLSKPVAEYYHKLEISSNPTIEARIWSYEELASHPTFAQESSRPFNKPEYIATLRNDSSPPVEEVAPEASATD